ncbi:MAG: penicillin-binding protein 2, partial [Pseudomonadota bacterium]
MERDWFDQLEQTASRPLKVARQRLCVVVALCLGCFLIVGIRIVYLSWPADISLPGIARQDNPVSTLHSDPARPAFPHAIYDRSGVLVAGNIETAGLYANPKQLIHDPHEIADQLQAIIPDLDAERTKNLLSSQRQFVWLHRKLSPQQQLAVNQLGIPGLEFETLMVRLYPHRDLFSHLIGFRDLDGQGLAGIEKAYGPELLQGEGPLMLTADLRAQHVLHSELGRAVEHYQAKGGVAILLDVQKGDVLAMVSLPDFNPNRPKDSPTHHQFSRATVGRYELGSVFKVFNTAIALDTKIGLAKRFDASKPMRVSRHLIHDYRPKNRWLSVPEVFIYSSNIGSARMMMQYGGALQKAYFERLGLLEILDIRLHERARPTGPASWREINHITASYGHGIAVTPLHFTAAFASAINGGYKIVPRFVISDPLPVEGRELIFKAGTVKRMRALLRLNTMVGSGKGADIAGLRIGGKTGTADKIADHGGYDGSRLISSFIAGFPIDDPRYALFVLVDEPKMPDESRLRPTGGVVAAPLAGRIIERIAPVLGVGADR